MGGLGEVKIAVNEGLKAGRSRGGARVLHGGWDCLNRGGTMGLGFDGCVKVSWHRGRKVFQIRGGGGVAHS